MNGMRERGVSAGVGADPRWARVLARDRTADGRFWYSVATTGVYCRPSCPSRPARPENVTLHDTIAQARATGCRPCLRCRPDGADAAEVAAGSVAAACRAIEAAEAAVPPVAVLAAAAGCGVAELRRRFRGTTGLTPAQWARARRAERARDALRTEASVTRAAFAAGFNSTGRFHEAAGAMLGMRPGRYRDGGAGETLRFAVGESSLGTVLVASSAAGVAAILLGEEPDGLIRELARRFPRTELVGGDAAYEATVARVVGLVESPGALPSPALPLDVRGTAFQRLVWEALRAIAPGEVSSYAAIAARIGVPRAVRAVAAACAANHLAVAIPCHRVVRTNGGLAGYAWGVERKQALLARERGG